MVVRAFEIGDAAVKRAIVTIWGQIWSCVVAPRQIPLHVDTGNLSRFPFGSRELDSIGMGVEIVQFAKGNWWMVERDRVAVEEQRIDLLRQYVNRQRPFATG